MFNYNISLYLYFNYNVFKQSCPYFFVFKIYCMCSHCTRINSTVGYCRSFVNNYYRNDQFKANTLVKELTVASSTILPSR